MAGVAGLEPAPKVLETSMLTIDTIPLSECEFRISNDEFRFVIRYSLFDIHHLFVLFMQTVAAAAAAKLAKLKPVRRVLFVFRRHVVPLFALSALQNYIISRHFLPLISQHSAISYQLSA